MFASYILGRVRRALSQDAPTGVDLSTRDLARPTGGVAWQQFSDEDLLLRIGRAENDLISQCDAMYFRKAIGQYVGPFPETDGSYLRILPNRCFLNGVRCITVASDDHRSRRLARIATAARPVVVTGPNHLQFFPNAVGATVDVLNPPRAVTLADIAAGTDEMTAHDALEEAVVQHVLSSIRLTQMQNGSEAEQLVLMQQMHEAMYLEEIEPFVRGTKPASRQTDIEVAVESAV